MKVLRAAALIALLAAPAYTVLRAAPACAQAPHINMMPEAPTKTQEEKDADEARDRAYRETLKKIPDAKAPSDPWGNVRSDAPKASANVAPKTPARPKTKTATNPN